MQCATAALKDVDGVFKKFGEDKLQCPYLGNIHKRKAPNSNGAHYWAFGVGKNNVYEHRHCGDKAKATTNELIMFKTSHSAVGANRGVKCMHAHL